MKTVQTEIFDKDGNLTKIEVYLSTGVHLFDALWDPRDAQTHENRVAFREWVNRQIRSHYHEVS
jgi:hypothetical protein